MRRTAVIGTSILALLFGTAAFASSQHDDGRQGDSKKHEDNKHEKEPGHSAAKPVDKHEGNGQKHQPDQRAHEPVRANNHRPEHHAATGTPATTFPASARARA